MIVDNRYGCEAIGDKRSKGILLSINEGAGTW